MVTGNCQGYHSASTRNLRIFVAGIFENYQADTKPAERPYALTAKDIQ